MSTRALSCDFRHYNRRRKPLTLSSIAVVHQYLCFAIRSLPYSKVCAAIRLVFQCNAERAYPVELKFRRVLRIWCYRQTVLDPQCTPSLDSWTKSLGVCCSRRCHINVGKRFAILSPYVQISLCSILIFKSSWLFYPVVCKLSCLHLLMCTCLAHHHPLLL